MFADHAGDEVQATAGRERHDETHRAAWPRTFARSLSKRGTGTEQAIERVGQVAAECQCCTFDEAST